MGKKYKGKKVDSLVDQDGVILGKIETNIVSTGEPSYFKTYKSDLARLLSINPSHYMMLQWLMGYMDYNNVIAINPYMKVEIMKNMGLKSEQSVTNGIWMLSKTDLLIRLRRSVYMVNPKYFAIGRWADIERIRTTITYTPDGRVLIVEFDKKVSSEVSMPDGDIDSLPKNN